MVGFLDRSRPGIEVGVGSAQGIKGKGINSRKEKREDRG